MKNWNSVRIGDIFKVTSGGTPSRDNADYYMNGNIPWIKTGDLKGKYISNPDEFITKEALNNSSAKLFPKQTVLLAMYGATIGACSILPFEAATNQACAALLPNNQCSEDYLYYFLKSFQQELIKMGVGGAQPNISAGKIKDIQIPLPPLATQQKIAATLDAADAYRQHTKALIAKYDQLAQSLFLDMFGDPVRNEKGWEVKNLKSISTKIHSGNTPKGGREVYVSEGITFFRSQNVWRNKIVLEDIAYIDQNTHDKMRNSSLKHRDILITKTGRFNTENSSLGRAAMFLGEDNTANVNGHVYLIRLKKGIINEFVLFIITTDQFREHIRRVCVGGIDKRQINKEHLEEFPIISPPIELQKKFTNILLTITTQKQQAQACLQKAEELFNSLLQRAFAP